MRDLSSSLAAIALADPPPLPPGVESVAHLDGDLSVACVANAAAFDICRFLLDSSIGYYHPQARRRGQDRHGRRREWTVSALPGYLTIANGAAGRSAMAEYASRYLNRFFDYLPCGGPRSQAALKMDVAVTEQLLKADPNAVFGRQVKRGDKVTVTVGPFRGLEAYVMRDANQEGRVEIILDRLEVGVNTILSSSATEIDGSSLELVA